MYVSLDSVITNLHINLMTISHIRVVIADIYGHRFPQGAAEKCNIWRLGQKGHSIQPVSKI